ncbi:uncharacterized protein LOC113005467 [Solenopsis invicta]|uniref:uncharacterized protein LOC113005467 n=1 Tax=Solenopsis invicta TaxID=13686 RepID=UPI000E33E727|nr:uncharacterized protein LOC113005467 [Solenopsis invicta]
MTMLLNSEHRLGTKAELRKRYADFMVEYLALGHMDLVSPEALTARESYYLPHHAVFKAGDSSNKIRVVFNESFRTTSGFSLNDALLPGPRLQSDLWTVLTRWRLFRVGFMADIVKMFRQIRIHPDDADLQRILWRADPSEEVRDYRLTTVTYGTASAPFLALRTLRQLAQDESSRFPRGSEALGRHSYVDDILAGSDSPDEARDVQEQLAALLRAGGFALSKWAFNWRNLCPRSDQEERLFSTEEAVGVLGVIWNPQSDTLALRVSPLGDTRSEVPLAMTKRGALSEVAKLFDPLGWAAPVLVFAKIFLQDLWLTGCGWDDPLPTELTQSWQTFRASLQQLDDVRLPRWVKRGSDTVTLELHGFSDASERAYAAAVYLRAV